MAFTKKYIYELFVTVVVLSAVLSTASAVDCHGKSFHCVNSTHFMICVDLGGGVSQAIDNFYIACPPPTVCNGANHFECEFPAPTTLAPNTPSNVISDTTLPWEEIVTTSSVGNTTKEFSENYMNTERTITVAEFSITTDTTVDGSAKTVPDIYINNELNVTEIVPTTAVETSTTQIDYIQQSISDDRNISEIQATTEYVTTAIVENVMQNTSETWNSNQTESVTASKENTQTTIENLVITETVTEPALVETDQITQTTTTLLLETDYLNTELPQVKTLTTQNESGTTNYGTNIDIDQILDNADVTQPTGISNNTSPAEITPLSDIIAETTTGSTEQLATTLADITSTYVYHSSTSAPSLEYEINKSSSANVSVISNLNSVDESGLLEKNTTQTITINDAVGETTTTFDAWVAISGNENPTTVSNSNIFPDVTEISIYLQTQTDVMDTKVTDEKMYDVLTNTQNPQDATTLAESLTTEKIQNNPKLEQPTTAKIRIKDSAQKVNLDMITTEAGINIRTTFSTVQAMEAQSPKQTSADRKIDIPTSAKNKENVGSTDQLNPINKLSIDSNKNLVKENITTPTTEINPNSMSTGPSYKSTTSTDVQSIITKDPVLVTKTPILANTELDGTLKIETVEMASTGHPTTINKESGTRNTSENIETGKNIISTEETIIALNTEIAHTESPMAIHENSLTTITTPNVAAENNEFYASDAVNRDIITKDSIYEPTTSNNAQSWIAKAPLLVTKTPKFSDTKLDGGKLDDRSVATEESNIQSSQIAGLYSKSNTTFNTHTEVINTTLPVTIEGSDLKTNLQNSIDTKQDKMRISQTVQIDAITEKPTKNGEKTFTNTIPMDVKETEDIPTREVVNPDIIPTDAAYTPAISNNDQPIITEASVLLTTEPDFADTEIDGVLLIEPAGNTRTGPSTKANGETKTTDAIKNGATDNDKNQSNRADLDSRVINAAYSPTVRNITHDPTYTKQDDTPNTQTVEISAITEQPTETNEGTLTMVTAQNVVIEKIGMPTGEAVNPDIAQTDAAYTPAISSNDQPMITEASVLLTTEPTFADTKIDEALLIEPAGIASTGSSTKANGETKTTDAIKNGATDNTKNQSNEVDLDSKAMNAAYTPTVSNSNHNPTDTKQGETTDTHTVEISAITDQTTETNEETLTMTTIQNVAIEKIGMQTAEAVNPNIISTEPVYEATTDINVKPKTTASSTLVIKKPYLVETKIEEPLIIEPVGITSTEQPNMVNEETKKSAQTNEPSHFITLPENPTKTEHGGTIITQIINTDAIMEPTMKNEESSTITITRNIAKEKTINATSEENAPTPITITDSLPVPGAVSEDNIQTKQLSKQVPTNTLTTQSFDEMPIGSLPDKTTHISFDKELASNTVLETAEELTTNTYVLPSTYAIELNLDKEPTTRTVEGTDKSATGVSTITNNDSYTMNSTSTNAQRNNNYQTIISGSNDETKLNEVNSKVNYTNVEKNNPTNLDNLETTTGTDSITKKGVGEGITNLNKIHDAISKLDVTSEMSKPETLALLQNNNHGISEQNDSSFVLSGSLSTKEETNGIDNQTVMKQTTESETTPITKHVADSKMHPSTVERNDEANKINKNPLDNYLIDHSNQDTNYQNKYSVTNVKETYSPNNNFDNSKQNDATILLSESLTPKDETIGIANQNVISRLGEGETTLVINNVPYSTTQSNTVESNAQASNIHWNPLDSYLIDQSNQDKKNQNNYSVTNVTEISLQNNNFDHSKQKDSNIALSESSIPNEESNGVVNQNVVSQLGESETTLVIDNAPCSTSQSSTVESNDKASNINWNPLDDYLIDQPNQNSESLSKSNVINTKLDGNDVKAVSFDPQIISQQPPTTSMTADRPVYVNPNNIEQNNNIATQERNGQLENTTDVKSLSDAENVSVAVTKILDTKDNFNLKTDELAVSGLNVLSATTALAAETTVAQSTQDSIQNTPQVIVNVFDPPLVSTVEETGRSVKKSGSNTEFSPNINENIATSNKDTLNIALSKNSDTTPRTLTSSVIEDGKVGSSTVESKNLPSQSVTKLTSQYELPSHSHGYSEMTTSTPNVNHVVDEVDRASKPMLDVLPLPINNIKLSTSVTDKSLLTDSTSESQTKNTIIITESYKSTTLNPIYANSRAQPGDNVGVIITARTIVNPSFNIQTQVKAQTIANIKDPAGHGSEVNNSQSAVIATTASIIEGANLRPPTSRTDYSLQHPQQTEQGFTARTNTPSASHIITRTEAGITETNNDNPNNIISPVSSGDVYIGIASQSVPQANNQMTDTARNNAKTVTQQNNSSTNLTSPLVTHNPTPNVTNNINKQVSKDATMPFSCISGVRGRYSDRDDCRKFYICVGNNQPIVGNCPENTVFSDIKKLCTKNLSHCIRDNEFKCPSAGRFSDFVKDNVYYICVNHKNNLYKFKFQCQKGYILNSTSVKCIETKEIESNESVSISNDNSSQTDGTNGLTDSTSSSAITNNSNSGDNGNNNVSTKSKKSNEAEESPEKSEGKDDDDDDEEVFKCKKEGKFPIRNECRRYYLCKRRRGEYRRKVKKCESGSVFHKNKKKCVDADSYEC